MANYDEKPKESFNSSFDAFLTQYKTKNFLPNVNHMNENTGQLNSKLLESLKDIDNDLLNKNREELCSSLYNHPSDWTNEVFAQWSKDIFTWKKEEELSKDKKLDKELDQELNRELEDENKNIQVTKHKNSLKFR